MDRHESRGPLGRTMNRAMAVFRGRDPDRYPQDPAREQIRALRREIARQSRELRRLTLELESAEQHERSRLANRLHQDLQQLLAAARLRLTLLQRQLPDASQRDTLQQACALLDQATRAARACATDLAPPALNEGTAAALQWLARRVREDYRLQVDLQIEGDCEIADLRLRDLLLQSVRELLFNVHKHAGVSAAEVRAWRNPQGAVEVLVCDRGRGMGSLTPGFGLDSMRRRLENVGGSLHLISRTGLGTAARVLLPRQA